MNKTLSAELAAGIATGFALVGHPRAEAVASNWDSVIRQHETGIGPNGERLAPASALRRAKDTVYSQGMIAAYRTATEF